jgi:hypothetical protein
MDGTGGKDKALLMTEKCQGENNVKYIYIRQDKVMPWIKQG